MHNLYFKTTVSRPLMAVLEASNFVDGKGEINYKDCRKIESLQFAGAYAQYMQALVEACEEINKAMSIEEEPEKSNHAKWSYYLQRQLQQVLAGGITHILKQDVVKPQTDIWVGGFAWSLLLYVQIYSQLTYCTMLLKMLS